MMTKRCIFTLLCATALFGRIPTADAYTVIVLASSGKQGAHHEVCVYQYRTSGSADPKYLDWSHSMIEQRALRMCRHYGGINPKIVLSTDKSGYFAQAVSRVRTEKGIKEYDLVIWGWSGPLPSPEAATQEAIANCKKRGGTDPRISAQWRDYYHGGEKNPMTNDPGHNG
jgi:hypothetical protein